MSSRNDPAVMFLLDTSAVSATMREDQRMAAWLSSVGLQSRIATCAVVRGEILFGLAKLSEGRRRTELEAKAHKVLAALPCEPVPCEAADHYANLKLVQQRRGLPLCENDLWVAATAVALGATLVSGDSDFRRIEMLNVVVP